MFFKYNLEKIESICFLLEDSFENRIGFLFFLFIICILGEILLYFNFLLIRYLLYIFLNFLILLLIFF